MISARTVVLAVYVWLAGGGFVACTTVKNPAYCDSDLDCVDSLFPFCDLNGEFPESNHKRHTCTAVPADCPSERCGCEPGAGLSCDVDQLEVCNADGRSSSVVTCAMGCSASAPRCLGFEPTNDLGGPLAQAAGEPDVVLPPGARIDTDTGLVQDSSGAVIAVRSMVIAQDGGSSIRVFLGRSFVLDGTSVLGSRALALVAPGSITLRGVLDASASAQVRGPGGQEVPASCVGATVPPGAEPSNGAGGGGNATAGASGGSRLPTGGGLGGAPTPTFSPLVGGCRGGGLRDASGTVVSIGGGGGGAVQLVSLSHVVLTGNGMIDLSGGGGQTNAGGGAGGTLVIEAPQIVFDGPTSGLAANGGAGGCAGSSGPDGMRSAQPALGPACLNGVAGGHGGTATMLPQPGYTCPLGGNCFLNGRYHGGGGSVGRARIATRTGAFDERGEPLMSAAITSASLASR